MICAAVKFVPQNSSDDIYLFLLSLSLYYVQEDFYLLEEVVLLYKPYKAGKPWKFAGKSHYYINSIPGNNFTQL